MNPYTPPRAEVADARPPREAGKPSAGARFLWAAGVCFVIFAALIVTVGPREIWALAFLGSAMFAGLSGLIALCIPVKSKAGFIIPAVLVSLFLAYLLGSRSSDLTLPESQAVERE